MIVATIPAVLCLVGALVYALVKNGKAAELGRIAFFCGLLVLAYVLSGHVIHVK